jgi:hypothetical protein
MKPIRSACGQCHGTDTQYECERGQCYAEEYQRQQAEREREEDEERRRWEEIDQYPGRFHP